MIPRNHNGFWRDVAEWRGPAENPVARLGGKPHPDTQTSCICTRDVCVSPNRYPSPSEWFGRILAKPPFGVVHRRSGAEPGGFRRFRFRTASETGSFGHTKTLFGGRAECLNSLSLPDWQSLLFCQVACNLVAAPLKAGASLPVRLLARLFPSLPAMTRLPVLPLAGLPAQPATTLTSRCASNLIHLAGALTAPAMHLFKAIGAYPALVALSFSAT